MPARRPCAGSGRPRQPVPARPRSSGTLVRRATRNVDVFVNVPFDTGYRRLFLALVAGLAGHGARPRSVLEVPASGDRLTRIFELMLQVVADIFVAPRQRVAVDELRPIYASIRQLARRHFHDDVFRPAAFKRLVVAAQGIARTRQRA